MKVNIRDGRLWTFVDFCVTSIIEVLTIFTALISNVYHESNDDESRKLFSTLSFTHRETYTKWPHSPPPNRNHGKSQLSSVAHFPHPSKLWPLIYFCGLRSVRHFRIARNIGNFETWSTYQGCEQVSYSDVPEDLNDDVNEVFDVTGHLPIAWTDKVGFMNV